MTESQQQSNNYVISHGFGGIASDQQQVQNSQEFSQSQPPLNPLRQAYCIQQPALHPQMQEHQDDQIQIEEDEGLQELQESEHEEWQEKPKKKVTHNAQEVQLENDRLYEQRQLEGTQNPPAQPRNRQVFVNQPEQVQVVVQLQMENRQVFVNQPENGQVVDQLQMENRSEEYQDQEEQDEDFRLRNSNRRRRRNLR